MHILNLQYRLMQLPASSTSLLRRAAGPLTNAGVTTYAVVGAGFIRRSQQLSGDIDINFKKANVNLTNSPGVLFRFSEHQQRLFPVSVAVKDAIKSVEDQSKYGNDRVLFSLMFTMDGTGCREYQTETTQTTPDQKICICRASNSQIQEWLLQSRTTMIQQTAVVLWALIRMQCR
jgi:hypothetical protein